MDYATHLANRMSYKGIKSYLSAISHHCIMADVPVSIPHMHKLRLLIRGIRRYQGNSFGRPLRDPITVNHLQRIYGFLHGSSLPNHNKALFWAASTLAFFGLLRVSEYTCPLVSSFNEDVTLMVSDLTFTIDAIVVHIKASKTDPFRIGCKITIGATNNSFCPRTAMLAFIAHRGFNYGPLFMFKDSSYLTRARLAAFLKTIFTSEIINTHSFRIGGATALSMAGFSDAQIQIIGRWRSSSFTRYLRISKDVVKGLSKIMSSSPVSVSRWDPDVNV